MIEELYNKIDMFCNETDWSKYPTYEHALEEFIKEIVEEETKELEKENAELKHQLAHRNCLDCSNHSSKLRMRNLDLEKENAELKTDYEVLSCSVGDFGELQDKLEEEQRKNNGLSDNLTKAKEIIKKFLLWENDWHDKTESKYELLKQAEQFLKESE